MRRLVALAAFCLVLAAGCGGGRESETTPSSETSTSPPAQSNLPGAPAIAGETIDGERISLESFRGKPVLVNVWSSW